MGPLKKTCVILPAFNEQATIAGILQEILQYNVDPIVVDDGSDYSTSVLAKNKKAIVITHAKKQNQSPGGHFTFCEIYF